MELLAPVGMFALFLGLYYYLHRRAERRSGGRLQVQWMWLAVVAGTAAIVVIVGAVTR